jgi:hypothetical protein
MASAGDRTSGHKYGRRAVRLAVPVFRTIAAVVVKGRIALGL